MLILNLNSKLSKKLSKHWDERQSAPLQMHTHVKPFTYHMYIQVQSISHHTVRAHVNIDLQNVAADTCTVAHNLNMNRTNDSDLVVPKRLDYV